MTADVVTAMDEPRLACPYPTGKVDSVGDGLVGVVRFFTQGVDYQHIRTLDIGQFLVADGLHVGDIGQVTKAVAEDGQIVVHYLDGHDVDVANAQGFVLVYLVQLDGWHAGIAVLGKAVWQHLEHALTGQRVGIDIDFAELAVRSYVVHAPHVVVVGMGDEDAVNLTEGLRHDLLAEVGPAVDEQACGIGLDECRTAQTLVVRVSTAARMATAADGRHATRCPRSKKCQLHPLLYYIDFRVYVDAKGLANVATDGVAEVDDLLSRSTAAIDEHQSLAVMDTGTSQ